MLESGHAKRALIQLGILTIAALLIAAWQHEVLGAIYWSNQRTHVGLAINGGIVALFLAGMAQVVRLFVRYDDEERAVGALKANIHAARDIESGVWRGSLMAQRYRVLEEMSRQRAAINQSALAATLVATEASCISLPKFVHNILILTGVFGTIVSLSIALLGASDMIGATANVGSLGAVIHGMSTALSTTMTAILAYLFFGYFYLRVIDVQAQIISRIEELTTTTLLPRFQPGPESAGEEFADIIRAAAALMKRLEASQHEYAEVAIDLRALIVTYQAELKHSSNRLDDIARLLRVGFRLNERNWE